MFGELISLVDLLRSGAASASAKRAVEKRNEAVLPLLETYFLLKDLVDEGASLITDAGPHPIETIQALPKADAKTKLVAWDLALRRQAIRMDKTSSLLYAQDFLEVVSPELREKLNKAIGSKFGRAKSLYGIGSALFFRAIFPIEQSDTDRARYIVVMAGESGDSINIPKSKDEIIKLRTSLESYRRVLMQLASADEVMKLSEEARKKAMLYVSRVGA